jgi:RES domain-containing protein
MDDAALASGTWRDQMKATGEARTQAFARKLIASGYRGLLVRSFASGANEIDLNLVLWTWSDAPPSRLILIDDENRLQQT